MFRSGGCLSYFAELYLETVSPGVQFVNNNLQEQLSKILQTEEKSRFLPEDTTDIKKTTLAVTLRDHQSHFLMENIVKISEQGIM